MHNLHSYIGFNAACNLNEFLHVSYYAQKLVKVHKGMQLDVMPYIGCKTVHYVNGGSEHVACNCPLH